MGKKVNKRHWENEFMKILSPKEKEFILREGYDVDSLANSLLSPTEVANMIREDFVGV